MRFSEKQGPWLYCRLQDNQRPGGNKNEAHRLTGAGNYFSGGELRAQSAGVASKKSIVTKLATLNVQPA